jgi:hypothetical protein
MSSHPSTRRLTDSSADSDRGSANPQARVARAIRGQFQHRSRTASSAAAEVSRRLSALSIAMRAPARELDRAMSITVRAADVRSTPSPSITSSGCNVARCRWAPDRSPVAVGATVTQGRSGTRSSGNWWNSAAEPWLTTLPWQLRAAALAASTNRASRSLYRARMPLEASDEAGEAAGDAAEPAKARAAGSSALGEPGCAAASMPRRCRMTLPELIARVSAESLHPHARASLLVKIGSGGSWRIGPLQRVITRTGGTGADLWTGAGRWANTYLDRVLPPYDRIWRRNRSHAGKTRSRTAACQADAPRGNRCGSTRVAS